MHELSLATSVLQIVEDSVRGKDVRRVVSIVLEIGALSAVEPAAMRFCFEDVVRGTVAEGARLEIVELPGRGRCTDCQQEIELEERYGLCPLCGGVHVEITSGDRMRVRELAVE